jgi:hypothetical protein
MANSIDAYIPEVWAQETLDALEENFVLASLVHRDFEKDVAKFGDVVNTRKPTVPTARAKSKGGSYTIDDAEATNVSVTLDKHYYVRYLFEDIEQATAMKDLQAEFINPAALALANQMEDDLTGLWASLSTNTVSCGTAIDVANIAEAWRKLVVAKAPMDGRWAAVLHPETAETLLNADTKLFMDAAKTADAGRAMREAELGRKLGFNFYVSQNVPKVTSGVSPSPEIRNCFFHPNAFALVTRPLPAPPPSLGVTSAVINKGGIGLRVVVGYDLDRGGLSVVIECLYGVAELYDELAVLVKENG